MTRSLPDTEKAYLSELPGVGNKAPFARSKFDQLEKRKLRAVMYREQGFLCIHCERRIDECETTPRIEHWYPISSDPEFALCRDKLHLSCPTSETCDSAKRDHSFRCEDTDTPMPRPVDLRYEDFVGFTSLGEIHVRSDVALPDATRRVLQLAIAGCSDGDGDRNGILNLNHPALVEARAAAVEGEMERMKRDLENGNATVDERRDRASRILGGDRLPEFVSIRVAWLLGRLGRGR